jgi:hypothetical protein
MCQGLPVLSIFPSYNDPLRHCDKSYFTHKETEAPEHKILHVPRVTREVAKFDLEPRPLALDEHNRCASRVAASANAGVRKGRITLW